MLPLNKQEHRTLDGIRAFIGCFFLAAVILPLFRLLLNFGQADIAAIFSKPMVGQALIHSLAVSLCATLISVILALTAAWYMARTAIHGKHIFHGILLFPMLIPSLSHGMSLIILWGSNGVLTRFFGSSEGIYGFWGILVGSVMYSFPVAYLMILDILRYEDFTPYEEAVVLGIPRWRRMIAISFPYLRKPLVNVLFATFTMIVTDYGVALMVGGTYKVLPVVMYEEVIGRQAFVQGSVFGVILLIPAIIAFFTDLFCKNHASATFLPKPFVIQKSRIRNIASYLFLSLAAVCAMVPIISFAVLTFANRYPRDMSFSMHHIITSIQKNVMGYMGNSILMALGTALLGTVTAFFCGYFTTRMPDRSSRFLHFMSTLSLAVPGIVLGLSYVMFFKSTWLYGTMAILILVNTIHFFSPPYLMMYHSMGKLNPNLEAVGASLGISRFRMLRNVFIPQTVMTLLEMFSYFFVNSMMTISAVAFLATAATKPVALMINQFEAQTMLEASAFISLLIWIINLSMKGIVYMTAKLTSKTRRTYVKQKTI